jgi:hypothetical protein
MEKWSGQMTLRYAQKLPSISPVRSLVPVPLPCAWSRRPTVMSEKPRERAIIGVRHQGPSIKSQMRDITELFPKPAGWSRFLAQRVTLDFLLPQFLI